MTRREWNLRTHRTILSLGVLAFGMYSAVYLRGDGGPLDFSGVVIVVLAILLGVYALGTTIVVYQLARVRAGVFVAHGLAIGAIFGALLGMRFFGR